MGLALRPDVYWAETDDGIHLLTPRAEFSLPGKAMHQIIESLAPYLDGRYTAAELTADLSPGRRPAVERLLAYLLARDVITELSRPDGTTAADSVPRDVGALVSGFGALRDEVMRAGLRAGMRLRMADVAGDGSSGDGTPDPLDDSEVVLRISDGTDSPLTARAVARGPEIWLGPVPDDGSAWLSGMRRLAGSRSGGTGDGAGNRSGDDLALIAAASQLVHSVQRFVSARRRPGGRSGFDGSERMTMVEAGTLRSSKHRFLPHPFVGRPAASSIHDFQARYAGLKAGEPIEPEVFSRRAAACVGNRTGVLGEPTEHDFVQIPLRVCRIEVSDPVGLLRARTAATTVTGAGLDFFAARCGAALQGLAAYASVMVDPRRLLRADGRPLLASDTDPDLALRSLVAGRLTGFLPGHRLVDGETVLVDVSSVFPALRGVAAAWPPPPDVVAAYSWAEAVEAALLGHCLSLTRDALADAGPEHAPPRVDLDQGSLDSVGRRCISILAAAGEPAEAYDLTEVLGVPVMACTVGDGLAEFAAGRTGPQALSAALFQAVLRYQAHHSGQPAYASTDPPRLRMRRTGPLRPCPDAPPLDATALAAVVATDRLQAVAVPLDHDPAVAQILPAIAKVVLVDA